MRGLVDNIRARLPGLKMPRALEVRDPMVLRSHLADVLLRRENSAPRCFLKLLTYNLARRLKTLSGLTPYEYVCKILTSEPERLRVNPIPLMPGLNS